MMPEEKKLFNKFEIISCLKKDDHASVYLAHHIYLDKKIILKTLDLNRLTDQSELGRFKREAKILARLDHPNIIKVLDFGGYENHFYISFEFFPSKSLRAAIKDKTLNEQDRLNILAQVAAALQVAHEHRVIHRDLKPENILIGEHLQVKLADFGLALVEDENTLTQKTSIVGTPSYMSPEQIRGEKLTPQSDLFSLGIIACELFSGKNMFLGRDVSTTLNNILGKPESDIDAELGKVPESVQSALNGLLRKNRGKRTASALAFLRQLPVSDKFRLLPEQKPRRTGTPILIIALLLLIIAGVFLIWQFFFKPGQQPMVAEPSQYPAATGADSIDRQPVQITGDAGRSGVYNTVIPLTDEAQPVVRTDTPGMLFIQCLPWADIYIDSVKIDTTPLEDTLRIFPGRHEIALVHPEFPIYRTRLDVASMQSITMAVSLDSLFGYLICNVYPWGHVSVDSEYIGATPFARPVVLQPGRHLLHIGNPRFKDVREMVTIARKDTVRFNLNFEKQVSK